MSRKKVVIYNDTSEYHYGCKMVMQYLYSDLQGCDVEVVDNFADADAIIINGEGTMHHDRNAPKVLLDVLVRGHKAGKQLFLVNTVFQNIPLCPLMIEALKNTHISVREVKSQTYLKETYDIDSEVHLDFSYYMVPNAIFRTPKVIEHEVVFGENFFRPPYQSKNKELQRVNIFQDDWMHIVSKIRSAEWFITGRHHEMYAACVAETPFVVLRGNTWKNEGLLETAGVDIPTLDGEASDSEIYALWQDCKTRLSEYEMLFQWMKHQPKFTFQGKL